MGIRFPPCVAFVQLDAPIVGLLSKTARLALRCDTSTGFQCIVCFVPQPHRSTRQCSSPRSRQVDMERTVYPMMTLDDWMKKSGLSESQVGEKLGVSPAAVNRYRRSQRLPKPDIMDKIEKMTCGKV